MKPAFKRIALLLHEDSWYIRSILQGLRGYSLQRNWILQLVRPELDLVSLLRDWRPHGIISHASSSTLVASLKSFDRPVVDVADIYPLPPFSQVGVDNTAVGILAADHLMAIGGRSFGYVGFREWHFSTLRAAGFRARLAATGHAMEQLDVPHVLQEHGETTTLGRQESLLLAWLRKLPKPTAVFAANDYLALRVANACRRGRLTVPDDVSILGVDNDELICQLSDPPISSIATPSERVGHEAADLLAGLMEGHATQRQTRLLPPLAVIPRRSSSRRASDDPVVRQALDVIVAHRGDFLSVDDLLYHVKVSRRTLERAFRRELGCTPLREIRRVHIEQAKALLVQTDLKIETVAIRSGFSDGKHLATVFKQETGMSPGEFRQQGQITDLRAVANHE